MDCYREKKDKPGSMASLSALPLSNHCQVIILYIKKHLRSYSNLLSSKKQKILLYHVVPKVDPSFSYVLDGTITIRQRADTALVGVTVVQCQCLVVIEENIILIPVQTFVQVSSVAPSSNGGVLSCA